VPRDCPVVVCFGGVDPSAGAGVLADALTIAALECHPACIVTALTIQDTNGVAALHPTPPDIVEEQARVLLADVPPQVFKLGALAQAETARRIAQVLRQFPNVPVILDPVLASGRGDSLAQGDLVEAMVADLLPCVTLVTPNGPEARRLSGNDDLADCAAALIADGARQVLITGGHEGGKMVMNTLYNAAGPLRRDAWPRLPGEFHGSGCTLASAIAAWLARGSSIEDAVYQGQQFTQQCLAAAIHPGQGQAIPLRRPAVEAAHA